jgi:hypothetical protein
LKLPSPKQQENTEAIEKEEKRVVSPSAEAGLAEERMVDQELVREMIARRERNDGIKQIARELGVDRKDR